MLAANRQSYHPTVHQDVVLSHRATRRCCCCSQAPAGTGPPSCAGATVQRVRPVSITHPEHFVNVARRAAAAEPNSLFANQFENLANYRAHLQTGEEIWTQTGGRCGLIFCCLMLPNCCCIHLDCHCKSAPLLANPSYVKKYSARVRRCLDSWRQPLPVQSLLVRPLLSIPSCISHALQA